MIAARQQEGTTMGRAKPKGYAARLHRAGLAAACLALLAAVSLPAQGQDRRIEDEIIYFVMPDRFANGDPANDTGGIEGAREQHGFDPTHKGFYHGGDLQGLTGKLDYIQGLGATAIWLTPVFVNRPVQGPPTDLSAGYHGYWITDFTDVDPHLGTRDDFRDLVDQAHARGIRIIMDIVVNHTADVIQYRECAVRNDGPDVYWSDCAYRSISEFPWTTQGVHDGRSINSGFAGDAPEYQTTANFDRLDNPNWAYRVFIPERDRNIKVPDWLNNPLHYHNRGNSHWEGESSLYGDFAGLDDVFTEHPRVVDGMLEIYKAWISDFRIDGFRIDTAKHVNDEFWRQFNPNILAHARASGIEDFYLFGESYELEPATLARFTREVEFPAVLDFAFHDAAQRVITGQAGPAALAEVFARDHLYRSNGSGAGILPTFIGNHDDGRIGHELLKTLGPDTPDDELRARSILGHALMMFSRGVPVIYYGDEQGFTGDGRDQDAREDMFPSQVGSYNDNRLIGTGATTAQDNFDRAHPIYRAIAEMARTRAGLPALGRGVQTVLHAEPEPGILALKRSLQDRAAMVVFNTSSSSASLEIPTAGPAQCWQVRHARGLESFTAGAGGAEIELAPWSFAVLETADQAESPGHRGAITIPEEVE